MVVIQIRSYSYCVILSCINKILLYYFVWVKQVGRRIIQVRKDIGYIACICFIHMMPFSLHLLYRLWEQYNSNIQYIHYIQNREKLTNQVDNWKYLRHPLFQYMLYIYYEYSVRYPNTQHLLGFVHFGFDMKDQHLLTHLYQFLQQKQLKIIIFFVLAIHNFILVFIVNAHLCGHQPIKYVNF